MIGLLLYHPQVYHCHHIPMQIVIHRFLLLDCDYLQLIHLSNCYFQFVLEMIYLLLYHLQVYHCHHIPMQIVIHHFVLLNYEQLQLLR